MTETLPSSAFGVADMLRCVLGKTTSMVPQIDCLVPQSDAVMVSCGQVGDGSVTAGAHHVVHARPQRRRWDGEAQS